jgi:hypothetical protein
MGLVDRIGHEGGRDAGTRGGYELGVSLTHTRRAQARAVIVVGQYAGTRITSGTAGGVEPGNMILARAVNPVIHRRAGRSVTSPPVVRLAAGVAAITGIGPAVSG